jgi:hypothetical protein
MKDAEVSNLQQWKADRPSATGQSIGPMMLSKVGWIDPAFGNRSHGLRGAGGNSPKPILASWLGASLPFPTAGLGRRKLDNHCSVP